MSGYRFAVDAFLVATFPASPVYGSVIDFGTGCGIIALLLARRFPAVTILGLELQKTLVCFAQRNVVQNALASRVTIVQGDICQVSSLFRRASAEMVVCNPPYRPLGRGRLNPHSEKAIARHEVHVTLPHIVQAARHVLQDRGRLALIYHPARLGELLHCLESAGLRAYRLRSVHPTPAAPASLVLVEAMVGSGSALAILPPLVVYETPGVYTAAMQEIFRGPTV